VLSELVTMIISEQFGLSVMVAIHVPENCGSAHWQQGE
jgi:hypothetical protein